MPALSRIVSISTSVSCKLQEQRNKNEFCDVTLKVENETFNAHRSVLAAFSDYFLKMFTTDMREKRSQVIPIQTVSSRAAKQILDAIYTGQFDLSKDSLTEILHAASMMQINDVITAIKNYMSGTLSVSNCYNYKKLAALYSFNQLLQSVDEFILKNIVEVSNETWFLEQTINDIEKLLKSDFITVDDEEQVFEITTKWVNKDIKKRKRYFPMLFKHVRLQFIPIKYVLEKVATNELVKSHPGCRDLIEKAFLFYTNPTAEECQEPRKCFASVPDSVILFSHQDELQSSYNLASKQWKNHQFSNATNITMLQSCAVATNHPATVFCGGIDSSNDVSKQVIKFDGVQWSVLSSLNRARCGAAAVFHDSNLFVFGGELISQNETIQPLNTVSFDLNFNFAMSFETLKESWHQTANDWQARSYFSAQAVNGKIYLIGGYKPTKRLYNQKSGFHFGFGFTKKASCSEGSSFAVAKNDSFSIFKKTTHYVGFSFDDAKKDCPIYRIKEPCRDTIVYSPDDETWETSAPLNKARRSFGCAVHQSSIYVFGGYGVNDSLVDSTEFMNKDDVTWTLVSSIKMRGEMSACVIRHKIYVASTCPVAKIIILDVGNNDLPVVNYQETNEKGIILPFSEKFYLSKFHSKLNSFVETLNTHRAFGEKQHFVPESASTPSSSEF